MNRRTVGFPDELDEHLLDVQERDDLDSYAEAVRQSVRVARAVDQDDRVDDVDELLEAVGRVDQLRDDVQEEKARADDLRRQLAEANRRNDDVDELVRFADDQRTAAQRRREASLVDRARWWLFGEQSGDDDS